jgi:hypothetical protein
MKITMRRSFTLSAAVIIGSATILGGCTLIPSRFTLTPTPTPEPTPSEQTSSFPPPVAPTTIATQSAVPTATASATTKGGIVKGAITTQTPAPKTTTSTKTVTKTVSNLYDTSFDSWTITNFPGQHYEKELILYNKSDKKVLYAVRAADKYSDTVPVSVNGSFEATGEILPLASTVVKLKAYSSDKTPSFNTNVAINFVSSTNQILATRTVKVTAYTPVGDRTTLNTHKDGDKTGNASVNVTYAPNKSFPIRLVNKHSYKVKWNARFQSSEADGRLVISAKSGTIEPGEYWDTDIHFTSKDIGPMTQAILEVTFERENGDSKEVKTLTINVSR